MTLPQYSKQGTDHSPSLARPPSEQHETRAFQYPPNQDIWASRIPEGTDW